MRDLFVIILIVFGSSVSWSQIDESYLVIGRNVGTHNFHDGNSTRIFGFENTLSATINIPSPVIEMTENDSVSIDFWNVSQGAPHTIHLHGLDVNQENDGVPNLSFEVHHMEHGEYRFKVPEAGTYIYHCHVISTIHVQAGMYGVVVVRPPNGDTKITWENGEVYGRDFVWMSSEIDTNWHTDAVLDQQHDTINPVPLIVPSTYTPQYFLIDGKSGTQLTDPSNYYVAEQNEKVYLRLANIGNYGVRYIFPSALSATTLSSDGRPLPQSFASDTVELFSGERYGTMVQLGTDALYPVIVEHFNLNSQVIESTQNVFIKTSTVSLIENEESNISIYPNPSQSGIFNLDEIHSYKVFNQFGQLILQNESTVIDIKNQPNGIYLVEVNGEMSRIVKL